MAENIGEFGLKKSSGAGKGSVISSTFGDNWLNGVSNRLKTRKYPCTSCKVVKPEGKCKSCGHVPQNGKGW